MTDEIPPYNENSMVPCHAHAIDGKYCRILCSSTAGMALKWFKTELAEKYSFKQLDELAENIRPGSDGLTMLPYFCGAYTPKYDPNARAVFAGVELSHTRGHFARAIMEAIAFNLKQNLEMADTKNLEEIRITGGGASSPLWATIKANVTGTSLKTLSERETACLGSALAAAVGIGDFPDMVTASNSVVKTDKTYAPTGDDYTEAYRRYCDLDAKMY
jgi:xylulokinase